MQQLTCNIDFSCYFYYLFFSFVLSELKPFVLKGKVLGEKILKKCETSAKKCEQFCNDFALQLLPFSFSLKIDHMFICAKFVRWKYLRKRR